MKRSNTTLIKDLNLQIDYLIGYAPQGLHWKREYHFREDLINNTLLDDSTPPQVVAKIHRIQNTLHELQQKKQIYQGYIPEEEIHDFKINDYEVHTTDATYAIDLDLMDKRPWKQFDISMNYEEQIYTYEYPKIL